MHIDNLRCGGWCDYRKTPPKRADRWRRRMLVQAIFEVDICVAAGIRPFFIRVWSPVAFRMRREASGRQYGRASASP